MGAGQPDGGGLGRDLKQQIQAGRPCQLGGGTGPSWLSCLSSTQPRPIPLWCLLSLSRGCSVVLGRGLITADRGTCWREHQSAGDGELVGGGRGYSTVAHFTLHPPSAQAPSCPCLGPAKGDLPSSLSSSFFALETKAALGSHQAQQLLRASPGRAALAWGGEGARWPQARVSLQSSSHSCRNF